jgi:endonuclease-3
MRSMDKKQTINNIYKILYEKYPSPKSSLDFTNEVEVWASVILSAQCTDKRVNIVTKVLFKKYKTFKDYAKADMDDVREIIRTTGFFNSKAKALVEGGKIIVDIYNSKLPSTLKELLVLPGIGRKVGNVILSENFKINEGIAIDTHNKRVIKRLGLTSNTDPNKIEKDIIKLLPKEKWNIFSLLMIEHGRDTCKAHKPLCEECSIKEYCTFYRKNYTKKV